MIDYHKRAKKQVGQDKKLHAIAHVILSELLGKEVDALNDAGEEGWQLVGITVNEIAYLKRPAPTPPSARSPRRKSEPGTE